MNTKEAMQTVRGLFGPGSDNTADFLGLGAVSCDDDDVIEDEFAATRSQFCKLISFSHVLQERHE